jgi:hypothetical protein
MEAGWIGMLTLGPFSARGTPAILASIGVLWIWDEIEGR